MAAAADRWRWTAGGADAPDLHAALPEPSDLADSAVGWPADCRMAERAGQLAVLPGTPRPPITPPTEPPTIENPPAFQPIGEGPKGQYQWYWSPTYGWVLGVPVTPTEPTEPPVEPTEPPTEPGSEPYPDQTLPTPEPQKRR